MCGIVGLLTRAYLGEEGLRAMADALVHRGPDDGGVWIDATAGIGFGHRRLAIVDLSPAGAQPMQSHCGRYVLTFNGEIYNHVELRQELEREGASAWRGRSDTETLLEAIARWGLEPTLRRVVGMFALGLWDRDQRILSLARDRLGEKPLYYGWIGESIAFASELKALRRAPGFANPVDRDVLALYLRHNTVPAPWSILKDVFKLEPGAILTLGRDAIDARPGAAPRAPTAAPGMSCQHYWSLEEIVRAGPDRSLGAEQAVDELERRLTEAVRLQMVADVPVGAFLSGGVDSSTIVALMRRTAGARVKTFTIGFNESGYDEAPYARAVAEHLGTEHTELYVSAEDVRAVIPELPTIYDEPFADSSQIPTYLISRLAREAVTVALSGDGADELFGGYNRYLTSRRGSRFARFLPSPLRELLGATIRAVPPSVWDRMGRLPLMPRLPMLANIVRKLGRMLRRRFGVRDIYMSLSEEWEGKVPVKATRRLPTPFDDAGEIAASSEEDMMYWDMLSYLPNDILAKVDRAAMAKSLETRAPFLDHRVVEQAWRTPVDLKFRGRQGKWILREILYRYVPRELIERPKAGFAVPIGAWLRGPLRDWTEDLLSEASLAEESAFDAAAIRARWDEHLRGARDWTESLWSVLMYQAWARAWCESV
jgi:asparagine synthase (glutamine-hydrolysing)